MTPSALTLEDRIAQLPVKPTRSVKHLPGSDGAPLVGHTLQFFADAPKLVETLREAHGPVFRFNLLGRRMVSLADPDAAQFVLLDKDKNFSNAKGWYRMAPLFDRGILLRDFEDHKPHRRTLQQSFKTSNMVAYSQKLNELIAADIAKWPEDEEFFFAENIKTLLLDNAASLFLGASLGDEAQKLNQSFVDLLGGLLASVKLNIPGTAWHKSMRGKAYIRKWLYDRVDERVASDATDFFTALCRESRNPEHAMTIDEVVEHTLLLLFAAHDTTTGTLSAMMSLLCEHPEWQDKLRAEMQSIDSETLDFKQLGELKMTDWVFKETLRLYPPVFLIPRRAVNDFEFKGQKIPANTAVSLQVYLIHRDKAYWTNPDAFDPARFSPERSDHDKHRYQWIPFGAGAHTCLGIRFAEMQTKTFMFHLLRHYKVTAREGRSTVMRTVPIPVPKDRLPLRISKI